MLTTSEIPDKLRMLCIQELELLIEFSVEFVKMCIRTDIVGYNSTLNLVSWQKSLTN